MSKEIKKLTVEIEGKTLEDLELALNEVKRLVVQGVIAGHDSNDTGSIGLM